MRSNRKWIPFIAVLCLWSVINLPSDADESSRPNGTIWWHFGPAVLNSVKRVEFWDSSQSGSSKTLISTEHDHSFKQIREWIFSNFAKKLDFSPTNPSYRAVLPVYRLELYSSELGGKDSLLMRIPLTCLVLGLKGTTNDPEYKKQLSDLRAILSEK